MKKYELKKIIKEEIENAVNGVPKKEKRYVMNGNEMIFNIPLEQKSILEVNWQINAFLNQFREMTKLNIKSFVLEYKDEIYKLKLEIEQDETTDNR